VLLDMPRWAQSIALWLLSYILASVVSGTVFNPNHYWWPAPYLANPLVGITIFPLFMVMAPVYLFSLVLAATFGGSALVALEGLGLESRHRALVVGVVLTLAFAILLLLNATPYFVVWVILAGGAAVVAKGLRRVPILRHPVGATVLSHVSLWGAMFVVARFMFHRLESIVGN